MFDPFFLNTIRDTHQKTNRHQKKDMQGRKEGKKGKEGQGRKEGRKKGEGARKGKEGRNWHTKFLEASKEGSRKVGRHPPQRQPQDLGGGAAPSIPIPLQPF